MSDYTVATCSYREFRPEMGVPVRISLGVPKFPVSGFEPGRQIKILTPGGHYFRAAKPEFDRMFYQQLDRAGVQEINSQLEQMKRWENAPLVLLCFEQLGRSVYNEGDDLFEVEAQICHRRMFAKWWRDQTGEEIPELGVRPTLVPSLRSEL